MSVLKKNVIANHIGQGWTAMMGLVFIPLYIKYLGIEAHGLIGIFAMLQAWLVLLAIDIRPHNRAAIEAHPMSHRIDMIQGVHCAGNRRTSARERQRL